MVLDWLKRVFTRVPYLDASARLLSANSGYVSKSFRYDLAVKEFTGWVFAAAQLNAQTAASVPLRMYVRTGTTGEKLYRTRKVGRRARAYLAGKANHRPARRVVTKAADWGDDYEALSEPHPALELLSRFNDWQCGYEVTMLRHLYQQLTGNAYVHVVTNRGTGQPAELFLMPSQWVNIVPAPRGSGQLVKAYSYGVTPTEAKDFAPDEVIHFRYPNPNNLYYGLGRVEAGWSVVTLNDAQHTYDNATYANAARPDYAVIVKQGATQVQIDRFETQFRQILRDSRDGGNFVTISGDVQLMPLQWPPKDLSDRDKTIEEISVVFGIPRDKLIGGATYANADRADANWLRDTIHPLLVLDEETLNERYLPLWGIGDEAFLAYDDCVPEDEKFELEERKAALAGHGWKTVNEVRAEDGLPEVEGGDVLPVPQQPGTGIGLPFGMGQPEDDADPEDVEEDVAEKRSGVRISQKAYLRGEYKCECHDHAPRTKGQAKFDARVQRHAAKVKMVLAEQDRRVLTAIRGTSTGKAFDTDVYAALREAVGIALDDTEDPLRRALLAIVNDMMAMGGTDGNHGIGISSAFDVRNPKVSEFAETYTPRLVRTLQADRARQIEDLVRDGLERGLSSTELAHDIEESPSFTSDGIANRAEMIARTESARAYTEGEIASWEDSGVVTGKRWGLAPGACEFCEAAAAQFASQAVGLRDPFYAKGSVLTGSQGGQMVLDYSDIAGPPLHPHDRCYIEAVMETPDNE